MILHVWKQYQSFVSWWNLLRWRRNNRLCSTAVLEWGEGVGRPDPRCIRLATSFNISAVSLTHASCEAHPQAQISQACPTNPSHFLFSVNQSIPLLRRSTLRYGCKACAAWNVLVSLKGKKWKGKLTKLIREVAMLYRHSHLPNLSITNLYSRQTVWHKKDRLTLR